MMDVDTGKRLGATGRYPDGKLDNSDQGEILFDVKSCKENDRVFLTFGEPITGIGFTYEQAMALADDMLAKAYELRGISS